ncbi:acetyl-CoA hydrolase/transferase family protein [Sporomusa aerivorans]|uniref:acetyl-CoA hydrolase/transferase family protein n=1 Tax=Sporomusa aerivorans TaxID=204936 RepID=UPI003529FE3B
MIDIKDRVRNKALQAKIVSAEEAAASIKPGMNIGTSGFTPAGYPKAVPMALAERMKQENFQINLWTGASVGKELDGALAGVNGIAKRLPYQTNDTMRKAINSGAVQYTDLHLSHVAQMSRYGFLGGKVDVAIVEACAITEEGHIVPTTSLGNAASFVQSADFVIVEINTAQPLELEGMHDVYIPLDPPHRQPIPLVKADDRIGTPYIPCSPDKIAYIVPCDIKDDVRPLAAIDDDARAMTGHLIDFLKEEIKAGRMPANLLPLQSGVGSVANAVVAGLADSEFENLTVYTEVIQDGMFDLIDAGKLTFASGTSITPSPDGLKRLYANIGEYRKKILLRPQEVANSPEIARRIGVIAMNTAIEFDIYGHVNSTHIMGTKMMNGIGGSGDFARNAYLTFFFSNSIAKNGDISSVVPMCSHFDHTEHDIDVFITERGVADVRGLSPKERARVIIKNCAHPDYQPMLMDYLERAEKATGNAHTPHILTEALSWHTRFLETGSMKIK